jgi:hypothetical protein
MKRAAFVCMFAVLALASAAQRTPKLATLILDKDGGWVSVTGVWRPDNPTKKNELMEAVTELSCTELSCFRHGGKGLVGTEAFCLQATAMSPSGLLDVSTAWLKVVDWNADQLIATDDSSICLTARTIFDLKRKTVMALDVRKPEAQGVAGACNLLPDRQTYYMQDKVDFFSQKSLAATK